MNFIARHPEALLSIFILSLSATLGGSLSVKAHPCCAFCACTSCDMRLSACCALSTVWLLFCSAGQLFIVHTIRRFGALLLAGVMTTRQFLSILVSSAVFGNPLSTGQWCGSAPLTAWGCLLSLPCHPKGIYPWEPDLDSERKYLFGYCQR